MYREPAEKLEIEVELEAEVSMFKRITDWIEDVNVDLIAKSLLICLCPLLVALLFLLSGALVMGTISTFIGPTKIESCYLEEGSSNMRGTHLVAHRKWTGDSKIGGFATVWEAREEATRLGCTIK